MKRTYRGVLWNVELSTLTTFWTFGTITYLTFIHANRHFTGTGWRNKFVQHVFIITKYPRSWECQLLYYLFHVWSDFFLPVIPGKNIIVDHKDNTFH